jgi:FtsP/CotA-like multicopper oxidase with cupredoxin domain
MTTKPRTFTTDLVVPTGYDVHAGAHVHVDATTTGWQYHDQTKDSNGRYRFGLINGSNARRYQPRLSTGWFTQIGSNGGLLAASVEHTTLTIAPGERYDVVVDFSRYRVGEQITLTNALGASRAVRVVNHTNARWNGRQG